MLVCVPNILSKDDVAEFRRIMDGAEWEDGRSTAGAQSAMVKRNEQLPPDSEVARRLGNELPVTVRTSETSEDTTERVTHDREEHMTKPRARGTR